MLKRFVILMLAIMASATASAQGDTLWTLEGCIRYAEEHAIDLRKQNVEKKNSELILQEGKWAFVPTLSASTNYTSSTGRVLDPTTYQFVQTNLTGNSNSSLSSDITIFEGGKKIHSLNRAKLSLRSAVLKEESIKFNLRLNIIAAYLDILSATEQINIAKQSVLLVESQLERSKTLLAAGSITESDVLQLQSQLFAAQNDVSSAISAETMAKLTLCDILEIQDYWSFKIQEPGMLVFHDPQIDIDAIVENHPDYKSSLIQRDISEKDLKLAKASLYPQIVLTAGYGSSFSDARKKTVQKPDGTVATEPYPFFQQYADNASAYVAVGLKIPILHGLTARNAARRAENSTITAELNVAEVQKQIRKKVVKALCDFNEAEDKYNRAIEEVKYATEAQRQIDIKYNLGTTDYLSWNTALVQLSKAQYSEVESKYAYFLAGEVLEYYYLYTTSTK